MNTALADQVNVTLEDEVLQAGQEQTFLLCDAVVSEQCEAIHTGSKGVQRSNLMQACAACLRMPRGSCDLGLACVEVGAN